MSRVFEGRFHVKLGNFIKAKEVYDNTLALYQSVRESGMDN
jgi:hypothetical protein